MMLYNVLLSIVLILASECTLSDVFKSLKSFCTLNIQPESSRKIFKLSNIIQFCTCMNIILCSLTKFFPPGP